MGFSQSPLPQATPKLSRWPAAANSIHQSMSTSIHGRMLPSTTWRPVEVARRVPQDRNAVRCSGEGSESQPVVTVERRLEGASIMTALPNIRPGPRRVGRRLQLEWGHRTVAAGRLPGHRAAISADVAGGGRRPTSAGVAARTALRSSPDIRTAVRSSPRWARTRRKSSAWSTSRLSPWTRANRSASCWRRVPRGRRWHTCGSMSRGSPGCRKTTS